MTDKHDPKNAPNQPPLYQIRIKGYLGRQWKEWFGNATITLEENGDSLITCPVIDQAALHGLLKKVRDLGLILLSVTRVEPDQSDAPNIN